MASVLLEDVWNGRAEAPSATSWIDEDPRIEQIVPGIVERVHTVDRVWPHRTRSLVEERSA
jgi:hypothetical protein